MTDPVQDTGQNHNAVPDGQGEILPSWAREPQTVYEMVTELRRENAARRVAEKEALAQIEKARELQLTEQEKYKELAEERARKIAELEAKAGTVDAYQETLKAMLDRRLEHAPEHIRDLLSEFDTLKALNWLDANADKLTGSSAPNLDAGKGSTGKLQIPPQAELIWRTMKDAGYTTMTLEEYAKAYKANKEQQVTNPLNAQ